MKHKPQKELRPTLRVGRNESDAPRRVFGTFSKIECCDLLPRKLNKHLQRPVPVIAEHFKRCL